MRIPLPNIPPLIALGLVKNWLKTVCSHNVKDIVSLYSADAILLGTIAKSIKVGKGEVSEYFEMFVEKKPCGEITSFNAQILSPRVFVADGTYTFKLQNQKGQTDEVFGRYTFVFKEDSGVWKIKTHHSSEQPI